MAGETAIFGDVYLVGLEKVQPQICCPMPYVVSSTSCIYRRQLASFDAKKCRKKDRWVYMRALFALLF